AADAAPAGLGQPGQLQHFVDARPEPGAAQAEEAAGEMQELSARHPAVEPRLLVLVADQAGETRAPARRVEAADGGAPGRGSGQPGQQPDGRRLAGAVGPEEAEQGAARDLQVEPVQGRDATVVLDQRLTPDGGTHSSASLRPASR